MRCLEALAFAFGLCCLAFGAGAGIWGEGRVASVLTVHGPPTTVHSPVIFYCETFPCPF